MHEAIKKLMYFITGCFIFVFCYLIYFYVWKGPVLSQSSANPRNWLLENRVLRGGIYARGGEKLAETVFTGKHAYRNYPFGEMYSHVIGYDSKRFGKAGLERYYNYELLGIKHSLKKRIEMRWRLKGLEGDNIYLTIDHKLQKRAWSLLSPYKGAAVVLNPQNGEVLALVSTPGFDPDPQNLERKWEYIKNDPDNPLLNRATSGLYPPGSTLKIITAAIGLSKFPQLERKEYYCKGQIRVDGRILKDLRAHGKVDLDRALAVSCNSYFADLGLKLGSNTFISGLRSFGWGNRFPFDLPVSSIPIYSKALYNPNSLAEAAIGQGQILVSPLFMALVTGAVGNKGVIMSPFIVKEIRNPSGKIIWSAKPQPLKNAITPYVAEKVQDGMIEVVKNGTGTAAALTGTEVAGKTGSAENRFGPPHAWFVGFAPAVKPRVAVSVLIENGGQGGKLAAPIARELIALALAEGG